MRNIVRAAGHHARLTGTPDAVVQLFERAQIEGPPLGSDYSTGEDYSDRERKVVSPFWSDIESRKHATDLEVAKQLQSTSSTPCNDSRQ